MADNIITPDNKDSYFSGGSSKVAQHGKNMFPGTGYPSLHAYYGPYSSKQLAHSCMVERYRSAAKIPRGLTVAIIEGNSVVEYQYKKPTPSLGYAESDLELKTPQNGVDADDITYTESANPPSGSMAKKIKELDKAIEDNAGSKIEPIPDATVDLSTQTTEGAHFTHDSDNKYVYEGTPTTSYTYEDSGDLYAIFKVTDRDLYLLYEIQANDEYYFADTYDSVHLPETARKEFELGKYATIKRISGVAGESWRFDSVSLLCTGNNNTLRYRLRNHIMYNGSDQGWVCMVKTENGEGIMLYKASGNDYTYLATVAYTDQDFKYYDKFFDYKEASDVGYDDSNTQFGSSTNDVQKAIEKVDKMRYKLVTTNSIADPTGNTYYDLTTTGQTSIDVSDITIANNYEVIVLFKTDSQETCSLITDEDQRVIGSTSFSTDSVYVLSVLRGVICICEAPLAPSV